MEHEASQTVSLVVVKESVWEALGVKCWDGYGMFVLRRVNGEGMDWTV